MTAPSEAKAAKPRFMREEITPALPSRLGDGRSGTSRRLPAGIGRRTPGRGFGSAPHRPTQSGAEDYSFIRVGDFLPHLSQAEGSADAQPRLLPTAGELESWIYPEAKDNLVVMLDGVFIPELSRIGGDYFVAPLEDSAPPDSPLPGMHLRFQGLHAIFLSRIENMLEEEYDAPAAIAALFASQPILVRVPAKRVAAAPLQILHLTTGTPRSVSAHRNDSFVILHAGAQSESRILVRHGRLGPSQDSAGPAGLENVHTMAVLEEGASLRFLEQGIDSSAAGRDMHLRKLSARLERDARLIAVTAHTGSRLTRASFGIDLAGEGADAELNGATVLSGTRQGHYHVRLRHLVPHGTSRQMFKTVAADQSRASVDGTIIVAVDAQQTNAGQRIHNLMLSDEARADSKPRLMIHADDVKCSHGATAGSSIPSSNSTWNPAGCPRTRPGPY